MPVVQYTVAGKTYKAVGPEKGVYIKINTPSGRRTNYSMAEEYPIGSAIDIFCDPQNPKLSYVLRYCNKKWTFYLTFISALCVLGLDGLLLFLL